MRLKRIRIQNVGMVGNADIVIDKSLTLFYGEIRQGKSTILNAAKFALGGAFPADIITHGESEALIELTFDVGTVTRTFYRSKEGETKARDVVFVRDNKPVPRPATELKRLANPFLLDQDYFIKMTELERNKFLLDLINVDTSDLDAKISKLERENAELRIRIKTRGDIKPPEKVTVPDEAPLRAEREAILQRNKQRQGEWSTAVGNAEAHNKKVAEVAEQRARIEYARERSRNDIEEKKRQIARINQEIAELETGITAATKALADLVVLEQLPMPTPPVVEPTDDVDRKISEISAIRTQAALAERAEAEYRKQQEDVTSLATQEQELKEFRTARLERLKKLASECPVSDLSFNEDGELVFQGTTAGMLSTSQLMELSGRLSSLYPEGIALELIDRAESLGKSVFDLIKRAETNKRTILATVVGDTPAVVPADIGVFVVEDGKVK